MTQVAERTDSHVDRLRRASAARRRSASGRPATRTREAAFARFLAQGFPTTREEEWQSIPTSRRSRIRRSCVRPMPQVSTAASRIVPVRRRRSRTASCWSTARSVPCLSSPVGRCPPGSSCGALARGAGRAGDGAARDRSPPMSRAERVRRSQHGVLRGRGLHPDRAEGRRRPNRSTIVSLSVRRIARRHASATRDRDRGRRAVPGLASSKATPAWPARRCT